MAIGVATGVTTWIHDRVVTTDTNKCSLTVTPTIKRSTVFGLDGWERQTPGFRKVTAKIEGFQDSPVDAASFSSLGTINRAVTIADKSTELSTAYAFEAASIQYNTFDAVGELVPFSLEAIGSNQVGLVRGQIAKATGVVSATGPLGSGVQLGAPGFGEGDWLHAALHIFSAGTSITVQIQSDDNGAFISPTLRATIGPVTALGGVFMPRVSVAGLFDDWWRFNVSAITGSFTLGGMIALGF